MPTKDNENISNENLDELENQVDETADTDNSEDNNEQTNNSDQTGSDDIAAELERLKAENEQLKANSKKWEKRSKSNFKSLEESQNSNKTAEERIAALEAELAESKARDARLAAAQKVAKETGFDVNAVLTLQGETEDELKQSVEIIKASTSSYPVINVGDPSTKPTAVTRESIEKIKNPIDRVKARAEHRELFQ